MLSFFKDAFTNYQRRLGGVSNVDMDGNNALFIKAIQVFISTFETLPPWE
jgi:hypothetical protein